jgi:hypothetical protein
VFDLPTGLCRERNADQPQVHKESDPTKILCCYLQRLMVCSVVAPSACGPLPSGLAGRRQVQGLTKDARPVKAKASGSRPDGIRRMKRGLLERPIGRKHSVRGDKLTE